MIFTHTLLCVNCLQPKREITTHSKQQQNEARCSMMSMGTRGANGSKEPILISENSDKLPHWPLRGYLTRRLERLAERFGASRARLDKKSIPRPLIAA